MPWFSSCEPPDRGNNVTEMRLFLPRTPDSHPLESQLSFNSSPRLLEGLDGSNNCLDPGQGSTNQHSYPKAESSPPERKECSTAEEKKLSNYRILITNQKGAHNHHRLRWLRKSTSLLSCKARCIPLIEFERRRQGQRLQG